MEDYKALFEAIEGGDAGLVSKLIQANPGASRARHQNGVSSVLWALYYGQPVIAGLLAEGRSDLDIFEAAALGHVDRLATLLNENPENANAWAVDGFQPLGLACFFAQPTASRLLLEAGAKIDSPSRNRSAVMPLHSAVAAGQLEIARILLRRGAPVNARQAQEFTPLHSAAQNGQLDMVNLLLVYGADVNVTATNGKSPLDLALEGNHTEVGEQLKQAATAHRVILRPYDPLWPVQFRQEAARLLPLFEPLLGTIYHIGSTSVPGLLAKPTIDILIEVTDIFKVDALNAAMVDLGYEARGEYGIPGRRFFVCSERGLRQFHVHTYGTGNPEIQRHVGFRDYLVRHPEFAKRYADLKEELALRFVLDRVAYTENKSSFIHEVDRLAAEEGYS